MQKAYQCTPTPNRNDSSLYLSPFNLSLYWNLHPMMIHITRFKLPQTKHCFTAEKYKSISTRSIRSDYIFTEQTCYQLRIYSHKDQDPNTNSETNPSTPIHKTPTIELKKRKKMHERKAKDLKSRRLNLFFFMLKILTS